MSLYRRGNVWWYEFSIAGQRVRETSHSSKKTIAREAEKRHRDSLERALAGMPAQEDSRSRIRSVGKVVEAYLHNYRVSHRPKSILFAEGRLKHVVREFGCVLVPDVTEERILAYMKSRLTEGASGRTVNMEVGELSRALGRHWSQLWPKVRKLEEHKDVGRALSAEEEAALLKGIQSSDSPILGTFIRIALLTGMRAGEIQKLTWKQINFETMVLRVGRAKTAAGSGREIPMNTDLLAALTSHRNWFESRFGEAVPEYYLFPFGSHTTSNPARYVRDIKTSWQNLKRRTGVECRFHDLRHTVATKMAEAGISESTMLALLGHMSRAMLERYSHVRMVAKRKAVESLCLPEAATGPTISPTTVTVLAVQ